MDKQTELYPHTRILLINKKEWTTATCNNMAESHSMLTESAEHPPPKSTVYDSII